MTVWFGFHRGTWILELSMSCRARTFFSLSRALDDSESSRAQIPDPSIRAAVRLLIDSYDVDFVSLDPVSDRSVPERLKLVIHRRHRRDQPPPRFRQIVELTEEPARLMEDSSGIGHSL